MTAKGMGAEFLPHVFERFTQADSTATRTHGGLGLGLAMTRHLVEAHGGWIRAFSDGPGTGSTFSVHLPILIVHQRDRAAGEHPTTRASEPIDLCAELEGVRIVAVDDDADARKLLHAVLTRCRAIVHVYAAAAEALAAVRELRPDVLLSDVECLTRAVTTSSGRSVRSPRNKAGAHLPPRSRRMPAARVARARFAPVSNCTFRNRRSRAN